MRATNRIGKFIINTAPVIGNNEATVTYLTLVTREGSFWSVRISYNNKHAFDMHMEMCDMAQSQDAALCAEEESRRQGFIEAGTRLNDLLHRLTSHA